MSEAKNLYARWGGYDAGGVCTHLMSDGFKKQLRVFRALRFLLGHRHMKFPRVLLVGQLN